MRRLALALVLGAPELVAQGGKITPGQIWVVNLTRADVAVGLNGATAVTAPAITAAPEWQTTPVKIGTRSADNTPTSGMLVSRRNTLTITWGGVKYVGVMGLGPIPPLASPGGLASTCAIYLTAFTGMPVATLSCGQRGNESTLATAQFGLPR